jgi:hypothetical protein
VNRGLCNRDNMGEKDRAIADFRTALTIDRNNQKAQTELRRWPIA